MPRHQAPGHTHPEPRLSMSGLSSAIAMPTLLIADDHPLFRDALRTIVLKTWPQASIHEAEHVQALYTLIDSQRHADLLMLDLSMPGSQGFDVLVHLRTHHPQLPIVIVSAHESPPAMRRAMDYGAMGFIPKSADAATIAMALQSVLNGDLWFSDDAQAETPIADDERRIAERLAELTPQQTKVLQMVAAGRLNKQIAYELGTSEATIKAHMSAILRKLGASNRTEAVAMVQRQQQY